MKRGPASIVLILIATVILVAGCKDLFHPPPEEDSVPVGIVTFDANGGSGAAPGSVTVPNGTTITLPFPGSLSRTNYGFAGWSINSGWTRTPYTPGQSFSVPGNMTLYAAWKSTAGNFPVGSWYSGGSGLALFSDGSFSLYRTNPERWGSGSYGYSEYSDMYGSHQNLWFSGGGVSSWRILDYSSMEIWFSDGSYGVYRRSVY